MCEHCDILHQALTECTGKKVAEAVMKHVQPRLHAVQIKTKSYTD